ncbi:amino acid ABC transporter permease [Neptunomonas sp.]|uniref:amino acid ABC transporter permease n=1 Tax=Neptunomonas sp. TaxID=1971898 RepID=UPI0025DAB6B1|nr:amino acid ABC transporter permease [Neptunomonas sp.]
MSEPVKSRKKLSSLIYSEKARGVFAQILVTGGIAFIAWYLISNTFENLANQGIATGYSFLSLESSFGISEHMIEFTPADSYGRALMVGLLNTMKVSLLGIIFASLIGFVVGVSRMSKNWILSRIAAVYINLFRNIPVLLQLIFWYTLINNGFPSPKRALEVLPDVFLSNRGVLFPVPADHPAYFWMGVVFVIALAGVWLLRRWALARQDRTGQSFPYAWAGLALVIVSVFITYIVCGAPTEMSTPVLKGFNFKGGAKLSPEFLSLLIGLSLYTSTYIADIVRSGLQSVPKGQEEASTDLGLKPSQTLVHVVLPQASRVMIPPLTSQYLNLTKNSSLAVAVGYPDLVSLSNTTMNQTGQAIEAISIFMGVYLGLSLAISLFMNWYNKKMALVER